MNDIKLVGSSTGTYLGDSNDISYTSLGDVSTISGKDRIKQAIVKVLLTKLYSSDYYLGYGSQLTSLIFAGLNAIGNDDLIKNTVLETLLYLVNIEPSNIPAERITQINQLQVVPATVDDITRFYVKMELVLGNNETVSLILGE